MLGSGGSWIGGGGPLMTYVGSTSGTVTWSMPFEGANYKKVIFSVNALTDAGTTLTFPVAFINTPVIIVDTSLVSSGVSKTDITLGASIAATGLIVVEGF